MTNLYRLLFLVLFFGLLFLPMFRHVVVGDQLKSDENRPLNQRPQLPTTLDEIRAYPPQLNSYFEDQFGFRREFIGALNKIKYYFFNEVLSKQITMGKNAFIYLNSHSSNHPNSMLKSVCGVNEPSKKFQHQTKKYFIKFIDYFRQEGINAHMVVVPTKARIYPENLPKVEQKWCMSKTTTWRDRLFSEIDSDVLYYPLKKMLDMKIVMPVYLPKSFHWHGLLPNVIAMDIMSTLWQIETTIDFEPDSIQVESDLRKQLAGLRFVESSHHYDYNKLGANVCFGKHCVTGIEAVYEHANVYHYSKETDGYKLVLLSDSFGENIAANFIRGFAEVVSIDTNNLKVTEQASFYEWIINDVKPSHLLYLIHDGGTYGQSLRLSQFLEDNKH